jgi:hypothetical protein
VNDATHGPHNHVGNLEVLSFITGAGLLQDKPDTIYLWFVNAAKVEVLA